MSGKRAKQIRRRAEEALYKWYLNLLPEEEAKVLTQKDALMYAQKPSKHYGLDTYKVDKFTLRWFIKQIKRNTNFDLQPTSLS